MFLHACMVVYMNALELRIGRIERSRLGPARNQVYRALRESIESVALEPGLQLSENELATRLNVSRTPIREALVRLRDDRLVEIVPQLGTFVARISRAALEDAHFVRTALESAAVTRAALRAGDEDVAALRAIVCRQAQARDEEDVDRFYVLDDEFHGSLCELSGHGIAWTISQRASGHLNRIRRLSLPLPTYVAEMVQQHTVVVDAIGARKPAAAQRALTHHLGMVLAGLPEVAELHPQYFEDDDDRAWARGFAAGS